MMRYGDLKCFCAEDVFCSEAGVCTSDADCKAQGLGNVCITQNGCTGCGIEHRHLQHPVLHSTEQPAPTPAASPTR
jgi:hypothetical protein